MSRALALVDSSDASPQHEGARTTTQLLETKLYVPRARSSLVARPRLIDAISDGMARPLTIIVAPAGFGKTTLVAEWIGRANSGTVGWLSLDPTDNEPTRFWLYVARALEKAHPDVGASSVAQLVSMQQSHTDSVLTALINAVDALDRDITLVLDDYHVIDNADIHVGLSFLLERMPRRMRLVIASRTEPPLTLARLRARGDLTELRAADLRFTTNEASAFFRGMSLELSPGDAANLEQRTEGWIAGLKLAALSMKGRASPHGFADGFSGDNRYIADYLVAEVLQSEPERGRRFLLRTSILDRLNASLCEAVTGEREAQNILEDLERRNLFTVALDDRREWYRYHHLFADVLQKQNRARDPDEVRASHSRASLWYEAHGSHRDAIRHALEAEDLERAAGLLERNWPEKDRSYESRRWLERVKALPESIIRARPVLSMGYAWALLNSGDLEAVEPRLRDVEAWLQSDATARERMVVSDEGRYRLLPAEVAAARVYLTQSLGEAPGTLEHAQRALELTPVEDRIGRATGTALVALALWARGDLEAAHRTFSEALAMMRASGHELDAIRGMFVPGDIRAAQGRLGEAESAYEHGLRSARAITSGVPETDELHLGLSELHRERNDLAAAVDCLDAITRSAASSPHAGNKQRWCTAMASVRVAQGDLGAALELLHDAERHDRRDPVPRTRPIPAMKARIHIAQGRLTEANDWAARVNVSVGDDLGFLREFDHITFARLLIARHASSGDERSARDAMDLLDRLRRSAQTGGRIGTVIEVLTLESLAQSATGGVRAALDSLAQALSFAEQESFMRVFVDHGTRMRDLLRSAVARGLTGEYGRRVLAAFDGQTAHRNAAPVVRANAEVRGEDQTLTTRELEILRLIAAGLRNQEIGDHLSISVATVKRHIANAYTKLGAGHRTEALARAKELKLL